MSLPIDKRVRSKFVQLHMLPLGEFSASVSWHNHPLSITFMENRIHQNHGLYSAFVTLFLVKFVFESETWLWWYHNIQPDLDILQRSKNTINQESSSIKVMQIHIKCGKAPSAIHTHEKRSVADRFALRRFIWTSWMKSKHVYASLVGKINTCSCLLARIGK